MKLEESRLLLADAEELLREISFLYNNSLSEKNISKLLPLKIKKFMDSIRSTLDYIAFHVFSTYCVKNFDQNKVESAEKKVYFPIRVSPEKFDSFIQTVFKGLKTEREDLVSLFKSYQPFPTSDPWLKNLNDLANTNKHRNLSPQKIIESRTISLETQDGGKVIFESCYIQSGAISLDGVPLLMDNDSQLPLQNQNLNNLQVIKWTSIYFSDLNIEVMKTLLDILKNTTKVLNEFEEAL